MRTFINIDKNRTEQYCYWFLTCRCCYWHVLELFWIFFKNDGYPVTFIKLFIFVVSFPFWNVRFSHLWWTGGRGHFGWNDQKLHESCKINIFGAKKWREIAIFGGSEGSLVIVDFLIMDAPPPLPPLRETLNTDGHNHLLFFLIVQKPLQQPRSGNKGCNYLQIEQLTSLSLIIWMASGPSQLISFSFLSSSNLSSLSFSFSGPSFPDRQMSLGLCAFQAEHYYGIRKVTLPALTTHIRLFFNKQLVWFDLVRDWYLVECNSPLKSFERQMY